MDNGVALSCILDEIDFLVEDTGSRMAEDANELNRIVGKKLRYLVEKRWDKSQEELAARLDVHQTHVSVMLRGVKMPSLALARKIALELDSNVDFIIGLTDDDKPFGDLDDQVVVTIDDPDRRAKIQAIADALRVMPEHDVALVAQLTARIQSGKPANTPASQNEYEMLDQLWMLIFMLAGPHEALALLDGGIPASPQFKRMIALAVAKDDKARNGGT